MSILKRLFGGGSSKPEVTSETYKGFTITPEPIREGSQFRIAANIEKDGKTHHLIRADMLETYDAAATASVDKARLMIDQSGDGIFG